jgi:outer membrane protein TolC
VPLAFSASTLWPPLAWAMMSGLTASTGLTLVVVPALYRTLFGGGNALVRRSATTVPAAAAAVVAVFTLVSPTVAGERTLTLEEALELGAGRPAASAAAARARSTELSGLAERRVAVLPTLTAALSASGRDRDLELVTPLGSFPFGDRSSVDAVIALRQPLLDPARLLHANPATRLEAEASRLAAERARQALATEAGEALLEVLAVEARRASTGAFAESLRARLDETEARVAAGRALQADALKIRLALERAELELFALGEAHHVAATALARATGLDGQVVAAPAPDWLARPVPDLEAAVAAAVDRRPDLAALDQAGRALERRLDAVRAEALPRLDAAASWSWSDGSPYAEESWATGAVVLTWAPFEAGTRGPRAAALEAERTAVAADLEEARRGVALEVRAALAELATARTAVGVAERGVEQAGETLRVETERHAAGRSTTNDLLEAETALRRERTTRDLARLDVVRAHLQLALATGEVEG